ncbi:MAG: FecR domain-containing protein [Holophagaceae bacterium]|nr:FecR domain-containing protein [Holophagaceae bacterium]
MLSFFGLTTKFASLIASLAILCPAPAFAQEPDEYLGERPERYAMVRSLEGNVRISKGGVAEALTAGIPIAEGDIIDSSGRGVIQFGDGSRIAFGERTRLEVAALFDDFDGGVQALFRLDYGRVRIAIGPQSGAYFRLDTESGSVAIEQKSNASIEVGTNRSVSLKVFSGVVAFRNRVDEASIRAGERLLVYSETDRLDRARPFNTYDQDTFEAWAERQMAFTSSESSQYVPQEIRYYADTLDGHGEWVRIVDVGWCWRPILSVAGWRPYWRGHWGAYRGGMTWVSYDPFGYVTHHHGRWGWSSTYGWYWIPGVYFGPAWVAWNMVDSFFGWAPLGYYNRPVYWGYNGIYHDLWNVVHLRNIHNRNLYNHIMWDRSMNGRFAVPQAANRSLTPPWRQGPLMLTRQEFNSPDPSQFRRALTREVSSERLMAYERQAGRPLVVRRDVAQSSPNSSASLRNTDNSRPFEDQSARRALAERPILRQTARPTEASRGSGRTISGNDSVANPARTPDRSEIPADTRRRVADQAPATPSRSLDMREQRRGESPPARQGRQANAPPPSGREAPPATSPPNRGNEGREVQRQDTRDPERAQSQSQPPRSSRTQPPPSRSATPPSRNAPPPARTSPPPDRSRNLRR